MFNNLVKIVHLVSLLGLGFLLIPLGACTKDVVVASSFPSPLDAAQNRLDQMQALQEGVPDVGSASMKEEEDYAADLGFSSAKDLKNAQLGSSLRLYRLDPVMLEDYKKGTDPNLMLMDTHNQIFPLTVNGQPRSLLTVTQTEDGSSQAWKVSAAGFSRMAKVMSQYRKPKANILVEFSKGALNVKFLAYRKVMLIPLTDRPDLGLTAGEEVDAEQVFVKLAPLAASINKAQSAEAPYTDTKKRSRVKKDVR